MKVKPSTAYMLEALIPYSQANIELAFKPHKFFNELNKRATSSPRSTYKSAYYRSIKRGLVSLDEAGIPRLTKKGLRQVKIYKPTKLPEGARLLLAFDIPETQRHLRDRLRLLLKELSFEQVQQSVWQTKYDHRQYVRAEIEDNGLGKYVKLYEALDLLV